MNNFGLEEKYSSILTAIFSKYDTINEVKIYGSRAMGTHTQRSDVDLVVCNSTISLLELCKVTSEINDSNFPYTIDFQIFENINNYSLKEHIERAGCCFYKSN